MRHPFFRWFNTPWFIAKHHAREGKQLGSMSIPVYAIRPTPVQTASADSHAYKEAEAQNTSNADETTGGTERTAPDNQNPAP